MYAGVTCARGVVQLVHANAPTQTAHPHTPCKYGRVILVRNAIDRIHTREHLFHMILIQATCSGVGVKVIVVGQSSPLGILRYPTNGQPVCAKGDDYLCGKRGVVVMLVVGRMLVLQ